MQHEVDRTNTSRVTAFATLWTFAHLFHLLIHGQVDTNWTMWIVAVAAIRVVARPTATGRLAALAAIQLVDLVAHQPDNPDHWILVGAVNACLLMGWLVNRDWFGIDRTFPAIRVLTLVVYGAAATSKWNTAFLDPSGSCAAFIADKAMFGGLSSVPLGAQVAVVVAVGAETLIFLALLVPSTRRFGVAFGIFFHSLVSLSPAIAVSDFSAALFALFILFSPQEQLDLGQSVITRFSSESLLFAPFRRLPGLRPIALGLLCLWAMGWPTVWVKVVLWLLFLVYVYVINFGALASLKAKTESSERVGLVAPRYAAVAVGLAFVVAGPYIGLSTGGAFTMFSNLKTEGPGTNHLFLPSLHLVDLQNEQFRPTEANSEPWQIVIDERESATTAALRRAFHDDQDLELAGVLNGRQTVINAENAAELIGSPSLLDRYWFAFRPVSADDSPRCTN